MSIIKIIWEYGVAMYASWISLVSGIASVSFTAMTIITKVSENGQAKYWFVAAFLSFVVASISVWHKDRPQLIVDLKETFLVMESGWDNAHRQFVTVVLDVRNTKPENNSIYRSKLFIEKDGAKIEGGFQEIPFIKKQTKNRFPQNDRGEFITEIEEGNKENIVFTQGEAKEYVATFRFDDRTITPFSKDKGLIGQTVFLELRDSYDKFYEKKGQVTDKIHFIHF